MRRPAGGLSGDGMRAPRPGQRRPGPAAGRGPGRPLHLHIADAAPHGAPARSQHVTCTPMPSGRMARWHSGPHRCWSRWPSRNNGAKSTGTLFDGQGRRSSVQPWPRPMCGWPGPGSTEIAVSTVSINVRSRGWHGALDAYDTQGYRSLGNAVGLSQNGFPDIPWVATQPDQSNLAPSGGRVE